jgi:excisionase family DNA binding protein
MDNLLSVKDVATLLDVNEWAIRKYIREGKLKAYKLGGGSLWRIYESDVDAFVKAEGNK